ncbi:hypothetical protein HYH03_015717 [Edaphochlamys debaryana]|uniref:protein-serine/threonine phosphatase n=1 Tax=Edaphochlamys debaryana TaxID=47281 RepID=A0A835XLC7_9CHLO|nr:hypothetical protein HYH03_015717 [Edaphochlamys debaryana]|eukprot:KAG2485550.1 hypothetical protein HYH03_015717 [Edaphochlamys debaryana]
MGCVNSKEEALAVPPGKEFTDITNNYDAGVLSVYLTGGPLTAKDYKERLVSSEGTQTVFMPQSSYTIRYAFVSQRGYYPDAPNKANQDSLCVHTYFGADAEQCLFGVFDGHGEYGTQCSQFAKDKVPENLLNNTHFAVSPEIAYHQAMVLSNNQLHRSEVDDTMSGTTAITVLIRGRTAYVANVGDSRAVLAERHGDKVVAQDLSYDQTPFRRDECERVKRCGARVLTLDQLEGIKDPNVESWGTEEEDDGDPPRLWAPNATYPGTAFTRSIGDSAAERIGVFAEPEVVTKQLSAAHPFVIIASDGVFEFLSSQSVVDMVTKFEDPQEACLSVVAESYRLWLQHETRTDDITMIVIQFQGLEDEAPQMALPTPSGAALDFSTRAVPSMAGMALRRLPTTRLAAIEGAAVSVEELQAELRLLQQKKAAQAAAQTAHAAAAAAALATAGSGAGAAEGRPSVDEDTGDGQGPSWRTAEEVKLLAQATSSNFLFSGMQAEERADVFTLFERYPVKAGDVVVRQSEPGDYFYVVESGQYDVFVQAGMDPPLLVHTYSSASGQPASFGELALLYNKPRAATVMARTDGLLYRLHRSAFRSVVAAGGQPSATVRTLRGVEVLQCLSLTQLQRLADMMEEVAFEDGEYVIRQGEEGRDFFVISSGEVSCTVKKNLANAEEQPKEVLRLYAGQYFGERALLTAAKRAANVVASGRVVLLSISRGAFEGVFGPLQDIIDSEAAWKEAVAMQREVLSRKTMASGLQVAQAQFSLEELVARGLLSSTEYSALMLMEHKASEEVYTVRGRGGEDRTRGGEETGGRGEHKASEEVYTVRVTSVADVVALAKQAVVMRSRDVTRSLEPSFFVPGVLKSFKDNRVLAEVLMTVGLCTLDCLMTPLPFDEPSAMYIAASVVLGLEHLHWSGVIYRGLSVHSVIVTEGGQVQLVDFRFARRNEGRAFTLCGNPEYLPPEVVEGRGHTESADLWALGVLIYCLMSGETPFASPGDDELRIYRRIVSRHLAFPAHFSPAARDLMERLLQPDPTARLGGQGPASLRHLKRHPWFAAMNWDALLEHRYLPPPGIRERIYNFEGVSYAQCDPRAYEGDMGWANNF